MPLKIKFIQMGAQRFIEGFAWFWIAHEEPLPP